MRPPPRGKSPTPAVPVIADDINPLGAQRRHYLPLHAPVCA